MYETLILYLLFALVEFLSLFITGLAFLPKKAVHWSNKLKWSLYSIGILPLYLYPVYFMFVPFNFIKEIFVLVLVIYLLAGFALYRLLDKLKVMLKDYYQSIDDEQTCQSRIKLFDNVKSLFFIGIFVFLFLLYYGGYLNLLFL